MKNEPSIDPRYAAAQLTASLRAADSHVEPALREKAEARARGWLAVLQNLASGALRIGHRQAYAAMPVWVTPDVLRGGFATGEAAAGGPLLPHELALAGNVAASDARLVANGQRLTPAGLEQLGAMLEGGSYRVGVPEESALLVVRWLIDRGERASAASLVETLSPFFDRLRFHPPPGEPTPEPARGLDAPVLLASARDVATSLRRKTPSASVEAMREATEVWAPITDALVSLVLETVAPAPRFESGRLVEGVVFAHTPERFEERRIGLLARYTVARAAHRSCTRPHRRNEVLGTLVTALERPEAERGWEASRVAHRIAGFVTAYGVPGSPEHAKLRAAQRATPSHAAVAKIVADRLEESAPPGDGLRDPSVVLAPVLGARVPARIEELVRRAQEAPVTELLEANAIRSAETLATLLPQLTGPALATRFDEPRARRLYVAAYRAFRRRRSLLLLWLQHQVKFEELPWILAMESAGDRAPSAAVREMLRDVAALVVTTFPETALPNKVVSELSALAKHADLGQDADGHARLPLVEEVASDIFMGTFSAKFLRAAKIAARLLGERSLYARYYRLPYERVLAIEKLEEKWGVRTAPQFDALCLELAALTPGGNPRARNGMMIEQASILTTHGLASLVSVLDLEPLLRGRWYELAQRAFDSALDRLERRVLPTKVPTIMRMRAAKQLAFTWRQMLFFLSQLPDAEQQRFGEEARTSLDARSPLARERFGPVLYGLGLVVNGGAIDDDAEAKRLLGWSVERPFLLGPKP